MATAKDLRNAVPNRLDIEHLDELGVQVVNNYDLELQCMACGCRWTPQTDGKSLPPSEYWRCPNRCNC